MSVTHHASDDLLAGYESGALAEGWSLAVATHLAFCPHCRTRARFAASVGGALLDEIEPVAPATDALTGVLSRVGGVALTHPRGDVRPAVRAALPLPLRSYLGSDDLETLPWRRLGGSARDLQIPVGDGETRARLLRIAAGEPVPEHGHRGMELTVVLSGTLCDGNEIFRRGDLEEADESIEHQPFAGPEADCVCLAVTDAPLRFKSLIVRLAQPFLKI